MDSSHLFKTYFAPGTPGHGILRKFYGRYSDVLQTGFSQFDDFLHEVFMHLSSIDGSRALKEDHYIHRAIKNQCWRIFNLYLKKKNVVVAESQLDPNEDIQNLDEASISHYASPVQILEGKEMMAMIMRFKDRLEPADLQVFNALIDGAEDAQTEIAIKTEINAGTVRTKIRRIRIALDEYLRAEYR